MVRTSTPTPAPYRNGRSRPSAAPAKARADKAWQPAADTPLSAFTDLGRDAALLVEESWRAKGAEDLLGLQWAFVAESFSLLARGSAQCWSALFDAQSQWMKQTEATLGEWMRGSLPAGTRGAGSWVAASVAVPDVSSPTAWFDAWQSAWTQANKSWLDVITHDVEPGA